MRHCNNIAVAFFTFAESIYIIRKKMKRKGAIKEYNEQRDRELHARFIEVLRSSRDIPLRDLYVAAAHRPASRFWVGEERATEVISSLLRAEKSQREEMLDSMLEKRREMYLEILTRVKRMREKMPEVCLSKIVEIVVGEEAPEFYLSDQSARSIISRIAKEKRKKRWIAEKLR